MRAAIYARYSSENQSEKSIDDQVRVCKGYAQDHELTISDEHIYKDEVKAQALCLGGTYLKNMDKQEADRYYKALVKTCGKTELGKMADKARWFPEIKPEMVKLAN